MQNAALVDSSTAFLATTTARAFAGVSDLTSISGAALAIMSGQSINDNSPAATFEFFLNSSYCSFVVAFADGSYTKAAKVELRSLSNGTVTARQIGARYSLGNVLATFTYATLTYSMTPGVTGYGVKSLSLMRPTPPPTPMPSVDAGRQTLFESNAAWDVRRFVPVAPANVSLVGVVLLTLNSTDVLSALVCGDRVVQCSHGSITEVVRSPTTLTFVVGQRLGTLDKRALVSLTLVGATVVATQLSARTGDIANTTAATPYAQLATSATAGAPGIGVLTFSLRTPVPLPTPAPITIAPTPAPTPVPRPPPAPNNFCTNRIVLNASSTAVSTVGATTCIGCGACVIQNDVWFEWRATCSGMATIDACSATPTAGGDTMLAVYKVCPSSLTPSLAGNGSCNNFGGCAVASREKAVLAVTSGEAVIIRLGGNSTLTFVNATLVMSCQPTPVTTTTTTATTTTTRALTGVTGVTMATTTATTTAAPTTEVATTVPTTVVNEDITNATAETEATDGLQLPTFSGLISEAGTTATDTSEASMTTASTTTTTTTLNTTTLLNTTTSVRSDAQEDGTWSPAMTFGLVGGGAFLAVLLIASAIGLIAWRRRKSKRIAEQSKPTELSVAPPDNAAEHNTDDLNTLPLPGTMSTASMRTTSSASLRAPSEQYQTWTPTSARPAAQSDHYDSLTHEEAFGAK